MFENKIKGVITDIEYDIACTISLQILERKGDNISPWYDENIISWIDTLA